MGFKYIPTLLLIGKLSDDDREKKLQRSQWDTYYKLCVISQRPGMYCMIYL